MPSSTNSSPTKLGGWNSSQRSNGGSASPTKPSSAAASRAGTPNATASSSSSKPSSATPIRHIPPGCSHLATLLHLGAPSTSSTSSSPTKIKSEDGDEAASSTSFDTLPNVTKSYLKRYIAGLRWGAQIRTGHVKMMDEEEKEAELAKYNDEVAKANKQGRAIKRRRKLDYPQCHTCQADMLRPFICLECAFTGCFSPPVDDDPTSVTRTEKDSHMIRHLRSNKHALAFDLLYGHVYCAECKDFVHDTLFESIQRHETCRVSSRVAGQHFGPSKTTADSVFPPSLSGGAKAALASIYETSSSSVTCRVPRGLRNMGATCFMNVIIQAFLHNPLLRNFFLSDRHNPALCNGQKTCLACEMDKIFAEFYSTDPGAQASSSNATANGNGTAPGAIVGIGESNGATSAPGTAAVAKGPHGPTSFLYCLWIDQAASELGQAGQHDAHELFISALNSIHTALTSRALERSSLPAFAYEHSDVLNLLFDHYEGGGGGGSGNQSEDEGMGGSSTPMALGGGGGGGGGGNGGVAGCPCVVHRTFAGQLQSDVTCQRCGKVNTTRDPMLDLSLDVRPDSLRRLTSSSINGSKAKLLNGKPSGILNGATVGGEHEEEQHLTICLQRYCSEEKLGNNDYSCTSCGGAASATKQLSLYRLPPVLCIQLKRFEHTSAAAKIDTKVKFPPVLDVRQFSTAEIRDGVVAPSSVAAQSESQAANERENERGGGARVSANPDPEAYLYDLFTVVVHEGSMNTGHYTNFSKWRGSWYRYDDDKVTRTEEAVVLGAKGAYQLCYRRRLLKNLASSRSHA